MATLTATPSSPKSSETINDDTLSALSSRKPTHRRISSTEIEQSQTFNRTNANFRQTTPQKSDADVNLTSPPSESTVTSRMNLTLNRQTSDDANSQQGKRKFSLSQYKERKRLKSDELQQFPLTDVDMRIAPIKNSPPTPIDDDPPSLPTAMTIENGTIVSPKSEEIAKEIVMKSNLSEPGARKSIKKKLVWADEKNQSLVQTSFFEVDDSELSEMHVFARNSLAHIPIAQLEKVMERDFRKHRGIHDVNGNDNDDKQFSTPLPTLIRILLPDTIQIPQIVSQERFVQEEREKTVLQALFIPAFLPDSPGEPDGDLLPTNNERHEAKLIPLDDDSGSTVSNKVTSLNNNVNTASSVSSISSSTSNLPTITQSPISTTNPSSSSPSSLAQTSSLSTFDFANVSPEVANILVQAKVKLTSIGPNSTPITNNAINPSIPATLTSSTLNTNSMLTTPINPANIPIVPNLSAQANFLSQLFNVNQNLSTNDSLSSSSTATTPTTTTTTTTTTAPTSTVPSNNLLSNLLPNLPMNFNLPLLPPAPANFPIGQFLVNALSLNFPLTTSNSPIFPTVTQNNNASTFHNSQPTNLTNPVNNLVTASSNNVKTPSVRFVSAMGPQNHRSAMNNNNHNDHPMSSPRENSRDHHQMRRHPPNNHNHHHHNNNHHHQNHHHHHHHRRSDYYSNRQQQQNNNNNRN